MRRGSFISAVLCVAVLAVAYGCRDHNPVRYESLQSELKSCTGVSDCPVPIGACLQPACSGNVCGVAPNTTVCPTGCVSPPQCDDGNPCTDDDCVTTVCTHVQLGSPGGDGGAPQGCCDPST